jgi:hypothetical protein
MSSPHLARSTSSTRSSVHKPPVSVDDHDHFMAPTTTLRHLTLDPDYQASAYTSGTSTPHPLISEKHPDDLCHPEAHTFEHTQTRSFHAPSEAPPTPPSKYPSTTRQYIILLTLNLAMMIDVVSGSALFVVVGHVSKDLGLSGSDATWM